MNHIPYSKLSKKKKKEADASKRTDWKDLGVLNPVTRIVKNKKKQADKYKCRNKEE